MSGGQPPAGFCPRCGGTLVWRRRIGDDRGRRICAACGTVDYRQPKLAAGVIIVRGGDVLLTRRAIDPYRGHWCLPAGFVEEDEGARACAVREAREETGLEVSALRVFDVYDYTDDPRGRGTLILYEASLIGGAERPGDDAAEVRWVALAALDEREVAFEQHRQALRELRERLRVTDDAPVAGSGAAAAGSESAAPQAAGAAGGAHGGGRWTGCQPDGGRPQGESADGTRAR